MTQESTDLVRDAMRYRRLRILGCIPFNVTRRSDGPQMFTNLDEIIDRDIAAYPSRGEAK